MQDILNTLSSLSSIDMADPVWRVVLASIVITVQLIAGFALIPKFSRRPFLAAFATRLKAALALKLDRPERGDGSLRVRGTIAVVFFLIVGWSLATLLDAAVKAMPYGWALQAVIVIEAIGLAHVLRFQRMGVRAKTMSAFSKSLDRFAAASGFDLAKKDHHSNARLAVMYQLYAMVRLVAAPVAAFLFFDLYGLIIYMFVSAESRLNTLGLKPLRAYERPAHVLSMIFNAVPTLGLAALYVVASIVIPTTKPFKAFGLYIGSLLYAAGWPMATLYRAVAGATGISIGGGLRYANGDRTTHPWFGADDGRARVELTDVNRVFAMTAIVGALCILVIMASMRFIA